jgi:hypothetical protein
VGTTFVALIVVGAVVGFQVLKHKAPPDCDSVRAMINYNKQFGESIEQQAAGDEGTEPAVTRYQVWATKIAGYGAQIRDPQLAERMSNLANLADETVALVPRVRADDSGSPGSPPAPQDVADYGRIGKEFNSNLVALDQACPAR